MQTLKQETKITVECAGCGKKEGIKSIHIKTELADLYIPYCPNCCGDEKEWKSFKVIADSINKRINPKK